MELDIDEVKKDIMYMLDICSNKDINKFDCHVDIQHAIKELSKKYGLVGKKEQLVNTGQIDVIWYFDSMPIAAFEINSGFKRSSIQKLSGSKIKYKFWIYYGNSPLVGLPNGIHIINKSIKFNKTQRNAF